MSMHTVFPLLLWDERKEKGEEGREGKGRVG